MYVGSSTQLNEVVVAMLFVENLSGSYRKGTQS